MATRWLSAYYLEIVQTKITKRTVDAVVPSSAKRLYVFDTDLKGFGLVVTAKGHKSYFVEYRANGGGRTQPKRRYTIGTHGSPWTPANARTEAARLLGLVSSGKDPASERSHQRHSQRSKLSDIVEEFIEKYAKQRQRSWKETDRVFRRDILPTLGRKTLDEVSKHDVVRLLDNTALQTPIMANRQLAYMRKLFNWCIERGYLEVSPCAGLKPPGAERSRDRVLDDAELAEVWHGATDLGWPWSPFVKLLILTAQRRNEVSAMKWAELDFGERAWTLPQDRAKNRTAHIIPLTDGTTKILQELPMTGEYVFSTTGHTSVSGFSKAKKRLVALIDQKRAGDNPILDWSFHDLRRTATTGMARLGIPPHIADAVLNHRSGTIKGVAAVYNRHAYLDERRKALEAWEAHVASIT